MNFPLIILSILVALLLLGWLGLKIMPARFPAYRKVQPATLVMMDLPAGLPVPVERFYRETYGERIPVIKTAVVSGRGTMRFFNLPFPIRFRFAHEVGASYRHDLELTFFGLPLIKGFETYIDGKGWANTPGIHDGEGFDQGSNVSLWAEALNWFPVVLLTDPRVQWRPVDDATAVLVVPFGQQREVLVVRFDPESGGVQNIEAMKFKAAVGKKVLWNNGIWFDEGRPWITLNVEETLLNADVKDYIRAPRP